MQMLLGICAHGKKNVTVSERVFVCELGLAGRMGRRRESNMAVLMS